MLLDHYDWIHVKMCHKTYLRLASGFPCMKPFPPQCCWWWKEKMKKRRRNFHVSLQPAVISNISISSLWWHREDSTFSGVIDVTQQQQLRSFAVRAAGLAASVCGRAALLLEVKFLTSHQSKGGLAPQLAAGLPDKSTCGLACRCITVANGMVNLWPLTLVLIFPLLSYSQTWLQRESWRRRRERGWRR